MSAQRKNKNLKRYEPPSPTFCSSDEEERDKYFLDDPDFEFDELPLPFRYVDKILDFILDSVNEEIAKVDELNRLKKAAKKVPIFTNPAFIKCPSSSDTATLEMTDAGYLEDVCEDGHSFDNLFVSITESIVYVAKNDKIFAIDLFTSKQLGCLKVETKPDGCGQISLLRTTSFTVPDNDKELSLSSIDLIFAFDDHGSVFVHAFNGNAFISVWESFQEQKGDVVQSRVIACELCRDASFLYLKRFANKSGYSVEIYKLPKDSWINEVIQAFKKVSLEEIEKYADEQEKNEDVSDTMQQQTEYNDEEKENDTLPRQPSIPLPNFHFSQPSLVATYTAPVENTAINSTLSNLNSVMKSLDLSRIANGDKHCLSSQFFNILKTQQLDELKNFMSVKETSSHIVPESKDLFPAVHFLLSTKSLQQNTHASTGHVVCKPDFIGIWWSTKNKFLVYNLQTSGRDEKHLVDAVYTNSDGILSSCASSDTKLVALALQNGNVVLWNRLYGTPSNVLTWNDDIDYFMFGQRFEDGMATDVLLVGSSSGSLQEVNWTDDSITQSLLKDESSVQQSDILSMHVIQRHAWLVLVAKYPSKITAFDLNTGNAVCQFQLPSGYVIHAPNGEECIITGANATKICVLAKRKSAIRDYEYCIFAFNVCVFSSEMDVDILSFENSALLSHSGLEKTSFQLLNRIKSQSQEAKVRQQIRWKQFINELKCF
eukprot:gene16229-17866_t